MGSVARTFARSLWPVLLTGAVACTTMPSQGGFDESEATSAAADAAAAQPSSPPASSPSTNTPSNPMTPEADGGAGADDGGEASDATAQSSDAAQAGDATTLKCPNNGTPEMEPNNDSATATSFVGNVCGVISPGTESDFLKFQLKDTSNSLGIQYKGNLTITFRVNGQTVTWGKGKFPAVPIVTGMPYILEVKSADGKLQNYSIAVTES